MKLFIIEVVDTQHNVNRTGIEKKNLNLVTLLTLLFPFHQKKYRVLRLKIIKSKMAVELKTCIHIPQSYIGKAKRLKSGRFFQFFAIWLQFFKKFYLLSNTL